jgi:hypothetical protein
MRRGPFALLERTNPPSTEPGQLGQLFLGESLLEP